MKRSFGIMSIVLLSILLLFSGCSEENTSNIETKENKNTKSYSLLLNIEYETNIIFSTYDAEIYVDDTKLGAVEQGETFTKTISLTEGTHDIIFNKSGDKNIDGSTTIDLNEDKAFSCSIKAHNDGIDINDQQEESLKEYNEKAKKSKEDEDSDEDENEYEDEDSDTEETTKSSRSNTDENKAKEIQAKMNKLKGKKLSNVIKKTKVKGYKTKYIATNTGDDLTSSMNNEVAKHMYIKSTKVNQSKKTITVKVTPEHIKKKQNKTAALSKKISKTDAWVAANYYGKSQYDEFKLHYLVSPLRAEPTSDGKAWSLKAPCTVNGFECECEAVVGGTGTNPDIISFKVY
ncbi:MAG: hypothetical protein IIU14_03775 [Ruminococcus sp.]|nr:hypothetical protein [Ruminococcus sp.]